MRWRQTKDGLIPIDDAARKSDGHFVRGDIESFVSPIDGAVITGRKQRDEHCKKHGVRPAHEYPPEHYEAAAKRREDHYNGVTSRAETQARRENINEIMNFHERRAADGHGK